MKKPFLIIYVFSSLFFPAIASAQLDPRCFTAKQCADARASLVKEANGSAQEAAGGFVGPNSETELACGKEDYQHNALGFCLPAGQTKTQISFGGKTQFEHLGDFIQYMYRYAIVVAGILATIMVIVAGFEWLTSGGNTERITSARKRIWGALLGLLFAVTSYLLLSTINPYLVQLRLPQVWLVNQQGLVPALCNASKDKLSLAISSEDKTGKTAPQIAQIIKQKKDAGGLAFDTSPATATCGGEYFSEHGGEQTCQGTACALSLGNRQQVCLPNLQNPLISSCKEGTIGGRIYDSGWTAGMAAAADSWTFSAVASALDPKKFWAWPWANQPALYLVCQDADSLFGVASSVSLDPSNENLQDSQNYVQLYAVSYDEAEDPWVFANQTCSDHGGVKGYVLYFEFNQVLNPTDEAHMLGKQGSTAIDLGEERTDVNLSSGEGLLYQGSFAKTKKTAPKEYFIQPDDLKAGMRLDIDGNSVTNIYNTNITDISLRESLRKQAYGKFGYK